MFHLTFPGGYGILHANRGRKPKKRGDDGHEAAHLKTAKDPGLINSYAQSYEQRAGSYEQGSYEQTYEQGGDL